VRVVSDAGLLDLAQLFIGPDVALFSSHYFCKMPRTGRPVLWHQDGAYWPIRPMNVVTLWVAVDESDRGNGCLKLVKGSHLLELEELKKVEPGASGGTPDVLGFATHGDQDASRLGEVVHLELGPGDVSIHHPNTIHASEPNTSDRRRCGLTVRYIPTSVRCFMEEQPVLLLRGQAVPGVNRYRSWPRYREGYDMPFEGCERWNRGRYTDPADEESYFSRQDYGQMEAEIRAELDGFIAQLGGL